MIDSGFLPWPTPRKVNVLHIHQHSLSAYAEQSVFMLRWTFPLQVFSCVNWGRGHRKIRIARSVGFVGMLLSLACVALFGPLTKSLFESEVFAARLPLGYEDLSIAINDTYMDVLPGQKHALFTWRRQACNQTMASDRSGKQGVANSNALYFANGFWHRSVLGFLVGRFFLHQVFSSTTKLMTKDLLLKRGIRST